MLKVALRGLLAHKLRLSLTGFAVVLGMAFVSSTFVVGDTLNNVFGSIFTDANQGIAVVVEGKPLPGSGNDVGGAPRLPVPGSLLATVQHVDGVRQAAGLIFRTGATLLHPDGKPIGGNGPPTFGSNWVDTPASPYHLRSGHAPVAADDVVVDAATATANAITVGQSVDIVFNGGPRQTFHVAGIVGYGSADNVAGATITLFTTPTAMRVLETHGDFDQLDVYSQPGVGDTALRDRIAAVLPATAVAQTGAAQADQQKQATSGIISILSNVLLAFGLISLFVGSFLIVNTFTILIAQRARELALLRALGATRRQVMTTVLIEALITGLLASAVGAGLGVLLAIGLARLIGFNLTNGGLTVSPRSFIISIVVGTVVTLAAAILPARRATRIAPVAALRDAVPEAQPITRRRVVGGTVTAVVGVVLLGVGLFAGTDLTLALLGAGALALFIGVAYLAPLLVRPVASVLGAPLARLRGVPGRLARENATRSPRRTASTAAALMIGVALIAAVAVLSASFKASGAESIAGSINAQLVVIDTTSQDGFTNAAAAPASTDKRLTDVTEVRASSFAVGSTNQSLIAVDVQRIGHTLVFDMVSGDPTSIADATTVLVDDSTARSHGWTTGSAVSAQFPYAPEAATMRIGGVYRGNALVSGFVISLATYAANFPTQRDVAVIANAAPGISVADGKAALVADLASFPALTVDTRQEFIDFNSKQIDQAESLIDVLLILSIVIAALGVVNTLALSVLERARELGLLRALGLTRRQTRSMVRWEAVTIALLGALLGIVIGTGIGVAVVRALAGQGLSQLSVPASSLVTYVVAAFIIGVLAAVLPARRAARLNILTAIATE